MSSPFKALADPTRRGILRLLQDDAMSAGDIAAEFAMTKPSISHHLTILRSAGLVSAERRGQHIMYSLETTVVQDVMRWLADLLPGADAESVLAPPAATPDPKGTP